MDKDTLQKDLEARAKLHVQKRSEQIPSKLSPMLERKIFQAFDEIKNAVPANLSEYAKVSLLYHCIAYEAVYDYQYHRTSYNMLRPLRDRIGVCAGYAHLLSTLIPYVVGCRTYTVDGYAKTNYESFSDDQRGHSWNLVCFSDGSVYHLDVTWDLCGDKQARPPKWLFKADSEMPRLWCRDLYPAAPKKYTKSRSYDPETLEKLREIYKSFQSRFWSGTYNLGPRQSS